MSEMTLEEVCDRCGEYLCDDADCNTYCCQGHCKTCGLSATATQCTEVDCASHCLCNQETN